MFVYLQQADKILLLFTDDVYQEMLYIHISINSTINFDYICNDQTYVQSFCMVYNDHLHFQII